MKHKNIFEKLLDKAVKRYFKKIEKKEFTDSNQKHSKNFSNNKKN